MGHGRLARRTLFGSAHGFAVLLSMLAGGGLAGCNRLPLRRVEIMPESTSKATTEVDSAAVTPAGLGLTELPLEPAAPLPVRNASIDAPLVQPNPDYKSKSSGTPRLDAALARAEAVEQAPPAASPQPAAPVAPTPFESSVALPELKAVDAPHGTIKPPTLEFEPIPDEANAPRPTPAAAPKTEDITPTQSKQDALSDLFDTAPAPATPVAPEPTAEPAAAEASMTPVELAPAGSSEAVEPAPAPAVEPVMPGASTPETAPVAPSESSLPAPVDEAVARADAIVPESQPEPRALEATRSIVSRLDDRDDWQASLERLRDFARTKAGAPGQGDESWVIRARVLDWLAGDEANNPHQQVWTSVLAALSLAAGPETTEEAILAPRLSEAVEALDSLAPLRIAELKLCRRIQGFGAFDAMDAAPLHPGQPVLVYCEMTGLQYEPAAGLFRSRLGSQVEIFPADGGSAVWSQALDTAEDLCRRRRRDYFVNYRIVLPASLSSGSYQLRLTQTDLVTGAAVAAQTPFNVAK